MDNPEESVVPVQEEAESLEPKEEEVVPVEVSLEASLKGEDEVEANEEVAAVEEDVAATQVEEVEVVATDEIDVGVMDKEENQEATPSVVELGEDDLIDKKEDIGSSKDEDQPLEDLVDVGLIQEDPLKDSEDTPFTRESLSGTDSKRDDDIEEISATDESTIERVEQEVQSVIESEELPEYSLSADMYEGSSTVNPLFKKSSTSEDERETNGIQVTVYLPDNRSITKFYPANTNIFELKRVIAETISIEPEKLLISLMGNSNGEYISDWTPLLGIPPNSVGGLILNLNLKYNVDIVKIVDFPSPGRFSPIITARQVPVKDGAGRSKTVTVVTEDISYIKEWLGGFRNVKTGLVYHNAFTETRFWDRKPKINRPVLNNSRDAQTHLPYTTKSTQVEANKSTQMWRPDHYIQSVSDKVLTAKPYVEYDNLNIHQNVKNSVIKIQRWYRRMKARRNVRKSFLILIDLMNKQREKKAAAEVAAANDKIQYLLGVSFPTTRNDFFNLFSIIGMWWNKEYNEITKMKSISERRAACYDLLLAEIELFSALERQRIRSKSELMERKNLKYLEESARPIVRHQRKRNMTIVETLEIQRAREIKEIYLTYIREDLDNKERIQVIISIINILETLDEIDYTKDLISLMRREIDMISMGLGPSYLQGLKKRIQEGLLHFVKDKNFNPQVKNIRPIHFPRTDQRSFVCLGCRKVKNPADSAIHVRLKAYRNCRSCAWMQMTAYRVTNIAPYSNILKLLRSSEIVKCPRSTYCFALQPFGAHFLINTLWNGKSALSENMNLRDLRLCRWDNKQEWSPWNTILLTADEANVHERIYDNSKVYESDFINAIQIRLITAKFHFKVMDETEIYCRQTGLWDSVHDENIYQHMYHRREPLQPVNPIFKPPIRKAFVPSDHPTKLPSCYSKSKL